MKKSSEAQRPHRQAGPQKQEQPEQVEILQKKISNTSVPLVVELGTIDITIQEFLTLGFNDVLQLDTKVKDELKCIIGRYPKFYCRPGTFGKNAAVQITRVITEGDEDNNE